MFMLTWSTSRVISLLSRLSRFQSFYSNGTERYSWVLFDPLSVHQNAILIWTTLWYWVIFLGITPPIICSSEFHSDMNCAPSYIFCWTECLITILTVLIWTIWEPQGLPKSFIYTIAGIQFVFNNWTTYRIQCPLLLDVSLVVSSKARILDHMVPN